jgi:hypothetical protein
MYMNILGISLLLFAAFVIWMPYHLMRGRKYHENAEESFFAFAGGVYITIICICVPIVWPFLILSLFDKSKDARSKTMRPQDPSSVILHADGKNWL